MVGKNQDLWILVDHPRQIINALGLSIALGKTSSVNLLISKHHYWNGIDIQFLNEYFNKVYVFPKIVFSKILPREFAKMLIISERVRKLPIGARDIILVLSDNVFLESIIIRYYSNRRLVKIYPKHFYDMYVNGAPTGLFHEKAISKLWRYSMLRLLRLEPILYLQHLENPRLFMMPFLSDVNKLFDRVMFIASKNSKDNSDPNAFPDLLPFLAGNLRKAINKPANAKRKIVFFGGSLHSLDRYQVDFTNKCLRYIERYFPHSLYYYKPHPHDKVEQRHIELGEFSVYDRPLTTEIMLINNKDDFTHYFSVSSTSIVNCVEFGLNDAYLFYKLYGDYSPEFGKFLRNQYTAMHDRPEVFIEDFEQPPSKYNPKKKRFSSKIVNEIKTKVYNSK